MLADTRILLIIGGGIAAYTAGALVRLLNASDSAQTARIVWRGGPDDPLALMARDIGVQMDARDEWLLRVANMVFSPEKVRSC